MWTADREVGVVFNGEIYNHGELRDQLKALGCQFLTDHSDTEVLLHGYRTWGDAFVERLNGMWAFVLYDRGRKRLFGSRDRFGKKPLYYFHEGDTFGFASELPALAAHPKCPRTVSELSLQKYYAYCYIPAPRSIYERVYKLPGGHSFSLELATNTLKTWQYWEFVLESDGSDPTAIAPARIDALCQEISATLEASVQRRLMSDVPLGVFLSGGIDSSAIAALAAKHVPAGQLNTFSIGFDEASFDESSYARQMAAHLGTRHREDILDLDKSVALLPEIVSRLDEPLGDGSLLPTYLLSRFTRQHVTVALGGDGGDELFAGYDPFRALKLAETYSKLVPRPVHQGIRMMASLLPVSHRNLSLDFKLKRTLSGLSYPAPMWNAVWMSAVEGNQLPELFGHPVDLEAVYSESIQAWDSARASAGSSKPALVDCALQWWTRIYLQDGILAKVDRASMLNSLEARSPFLDLEMANLARRIPHQLKLRGGQTKWILKQAMAPLLPGDIINRPKKGFGMPIGRWLREGRFQFDTHGAGPGAAFLKRKLADHMAGRSDERLFLWSQWVLSNWKP